MLGSSSTIRIFVVPMTCPLCPSPAPWPARRLAALGRCGSRTHPRSQWQCDRELATFLWRAFDQHLSSMRPRDVPHQRKAQPGSFDVVHQWIPTAVELLENLLLLVLSNADPMILDF